LPLDVQTRRIWDLSASSTRAQALRWSAPGCRCLENAMSTPIELPTLPPRLSDDGDDGASFADMFELAPVALWLEDYSELKLLFEQWRGAGVIDLRAHLRAHPALVPECSARIRVLKVNRRTLELFGADSLPHLVANLGRVFRDDMFDQHVEELAALWDGRNRFASTTVNYTLSGRRLDISLHGTVLPGHESTWRRVLLAIEDVTETARATRSLARSERYARGLFEHSPVSLWVEDFSKVKACLEEVRALGITDFRVFIDVHPEFVGRCMREIRVMDVNQQTLKMFAAPDKDTLLSRLNEVLRDDIRNHFAGQLVDLWDGKLFQRREVVNYTLDGEAVDVHMQLSVLPGYEDSWELVLVSLTDITARKKAEAYLEFLGKHDVLTQLRNRSYFEDDLARVERQGPFPATVVMADLNGLKAVNDSLGHAAGDRLLRRVGEILSKAAGEGATAARLGGDEFGILLPGVDERGAAQLAERIELLTELNNQFYHGPRVSLAIGSATCPQGGRLEQAMTQADLCMYAAKKEHYAAMAHDRRNPSADAL
jgi:diguanylate cyclase (GGDEF)-like protein